MNLEEALRGQEERADDLLKAANRYIGALKTWKKSCQNGHVGNLQKAIAQARDLAPALGPAADEAAQAWTFDAREYLESGEWRRDVQAAGDKLGLRVMEEGDTLLSSPVVIRAQPARQSLFIGKVGWPLLRPHIVALELKRLRDRAQSANSQEFLDGLLAAALQLNKAGDRGASDKAEKAAEAPSSAFARFRDIYDLFSITPGWKKENSPAVFGQALYALHRADLRVTRSGRKFEIMFPSGNVKEKDVYSVVAEDGRSIRYYGIEFF